MKPKDIKNNEELIQTKEGAIVVVAKGMDEWRNAPLETLRFYLRPYLNPLTGGRDQALLTSAVVQVKSLDQIVEVEEENQEFNQGFAFYREFDVCLAQPADQEDIVIGKMRGYQLELDLLFDLLKEDGELSQRVYERLVPELSAYWNELLDVKKWDAKKLEQKWGVELRDEAQVLAYRCAFLITQMEVSPSFQPGLQTHLIMSKLLRSYYGLFPGGSLQFVIYQRLMRQDEKDAFLFTDEELGLASLGYRMVEGYDGIYFYKKLVG